MKKIFRGGLLSLLMILTLATSLKADGEVAQIGDTPYATLASAIEAAGDSATITLLTDVNESVTIPSSKNITLDLNGHTLTGTSSDTVYVTNDSTLTINATNGGSVLAAADGCAAVFNNGAVNINGGTYDRSNSSKWYVIVNHGAMNINGGTFNNSTSGDTSSLVENGYGNYNHPFVNDRVSYNIDSPISSANPELKVYGGNFNAGTGSNAIKNDGGATLLVEGGTFTGANNNGAVIQNWNVATIKGGTFSATSSSTAISNGSINDPDDNAYAGILQITGGTFSVDTGKLFASGQGSSESASVVVNGGTYSGDLVSDSIASSIVINEGFFQNLNHDNNAKVTVNGATAEMNNEYYVGSKTINNAIESVQADGTIITIVSGSVDITSSNSNVIIKNSDENTDGTVTVNGNKVNAGSGVNGNIAAPKQENTNTNNSSSSSTSTEHHVTCEEYMRSDNWTWSEETQSCVLKVTTVTQQTNDGYVVPNTAVK